MKKRYLKTVEDVLALKDTDTKIYDSSYNETDTYHKFVNGVLCRFDTNGGIKLNDGVYLKAHDYYVYEEDPMQEATEKDLGCLCYCWDEENDKEELGILKDYDTSDEDKYHIDGLGYYKHCRRLSPSEVAELTGYKVEKAE